MSEQLELQRQAYYDKLLAVSRDNHWTGWCVFFLTALTEQASKNEVKAREILQLHQRKKEQIATVIHSQHAIRTLDFLFGQPIFSGTHFVQQSGVPAPTARRILRQCSENVLRQVVHPGKGQKPTVYRFPDLMKITEK